jgi:hypothetical protein
MKIYVNGDSHAAGAEAVNSHAFAEDDSRYFYMGRAPHPENAAVCWPTVLARIIKAVMHNDSESASSNQRILRTTRDWIRLNQRWLPETVVLIQWSTWERQEWLIDGQYYQVNASGQDQVPASHHDAYRQFIAEVDWDQCMRYWHREIWNLHQELEQLGVRHVFMNGNSHFARIPESDRLEWNSSYLAPYDAAGTYDAWLKNHNFQTVSPDSWHFGADAHAAWAKFVLQYGNNNQIWT